MFWDKLANSSVEFFWIIKNLLIKLISSIFVVCSQKTNGRLSTASNVVFRGQKTNGNLHATLGFLICCQKANFKYLKNFVFVFKEQKAVCVQF